MIFIYVKIYVSDERAWKSTFFKKKDIISVGKDGDNAVIYIKNAKYKCEESYDEVVRQMNGELKH